MKLDEIRNKVLDKTNFKNLNDFFVFSIQFNEYIQNNIQAEIISQNENNYSFFQFNEDGFYQITRPINNNIFIKSSNLEQILNEFLNILRNIKDIDKRKRIYKDIINNITYTIQQSIGCALDSLPIGQSNKARKINGDLFEILVKLIINEIGIKNESEIIFLPVKIKNEKLFNMSYQHDLIIKNKSKIKLIGSIKTTSKDRIDKIFIDKFLYNKLTETNIPHIAIFLNDVQRKKTKLENQYGINSTFLSGHFKGYSLKLNPLDGVYYCDIRPNMISDSLLKKHIKTFDQFILKDIWRFFK